MRRASDQSNNDMSPYSDRYSKDISYNPTRYDTGVDEDFWITMFTPDIQGANDNTSMAYGHSTFDGSDDEW